MPPPSRNATINYVQCALKRISNYIIDCMASYYGVPANCLTATLICTDLFDLWYQSVSCMYIHLSVHVSTHIMVGVKKVNVCDCNYAAITNYCML